MSVIDVKGFGMLSTEFVSLRSPGQSFTCSEMHAGVNVTNDAEFDIAFVRLDGGYFDDGNSCDYSVSSNTDDSSGMLIELKGRHVDHALEQLCATIDRLRKRMVSVRYKLAAVVSSGGSKMPSADWQKKQKAFLSETGVRLGRFLNHSKISFLTVVG